MLLLQKFKISGHSMEPILKNGESVLVSSVPYLFKNPKIDDIVAFKEKAGKILIKRIKTCKNGKYFVKGDNKKDSFDSRDFGFVSRELILGKLIYKL